MEQLIEYTHRKMRFITYSLASALEGMRLELLALFALVLSLSAAAIEENSDRTIEAFRKLMQVRAGKRDGWNMFCERLGVPPDSITAPQRRSSNTVIGRWRGRRRS